MDSLLVALLVVGVAMVIGFSGKDVREPPQKVKPYLPPRRLGSVSEETMRSFAMGQFSVTDADLHDALEDK